MRIVSHPLLLYFLIVYSIVFLMKTKKNSEFLLILTIFLFFIERNYWINAITSLTSEPIRTQPTDIALIILLIFIIKEYLKSKKALIMGSNFFSLFIAYISLVTLIGIFRFGYSAIAEFRTIFYFLIIMLYIHLCVNKEEIINIIKKISSYLIPLILLVPINLILMNNFNISVDNRQLSAFMYQSITLGFTAGILYNRFIDANYKLPWLFLPIFFLSIPYTSHRTVWGALIIMLPLLMYWIGIRKTLVWIALFTLIISNLFTLDSNFLQERLTAFTDIEQDNTGGWRLLVWNAIIQDASLLGKGIGARFIVYADKIGFDAMYGAHNGFMLILYYLGYIGLLLTILLFAYFFITITKNLRLYTYDKSALTINRIGFLSLLSLIAYMIGYGFDLISIIFIALALKLKNYNN